MLRTVLTIAALFTASGVFASNYNFLHDAAPIADFKDTDIEMFQTAIQKALNEKKDGEKLAWKNKKTGNSGLVNPILTLDDDLVNCRNVRIINKSKKNIAESRFKFCKQDGRWVAIEMLKK